ncbi:MAG TPA: MucB/RseB C-terminal domain-containing protein [Burkholderiaceae bacterium]
MAQVLSPGLLLAAPVRARRALARVTPARATLRRWSPARSAARPALLPRVDAMRGALLRVSRFSGALVCAAALTAGSARVLAQAQRAPALPPPVASGESAGDLRAWLARIHDAAVRSNYVGTIVNSTGTSVMSSRVGHYFDGRSTLERIDALDGEPRSMLRINDEERTLWPRYRVAVIEPADPRAAFPALVSGNEKHIPDFYELHVQPAQRIAGHDADRLLLKARDDSRFDHVIWADHATGLLLRVDVQLAGRTLESSGFSDVNIGVKPDAAAVYNELHRADGFRVVRPAIEHTKLDAEGWTMQASMLPAGFMALDCVRRALDLPGDAAGQAKVLQAIWSDGITHVSLFIEPFQPQRHRSEGLTVIGATHTLTRRVNEMWLTAVGDVPPAALDQFVRALERK